MTAQCRGAWRNPFGAAVFSFSGGPAAFFDEAVVGPAGQGEFGDVDRPVVFDPAVDVVHLAPVAGRGAAWPGAAAVEGKTMWVVHRSSRAFQFTVPSIIALRYRPSSPGPGVVPTVAADCYTARADRRSVPYISAG